MLLTRRLERAKMRPLGFVCNDYGIAVWGLGDMSAAIARDALSLDDLFAQDMLGDDLEAWLAESALMKRTFRSCAIIAGLIERRFPGQEKNGRQVTMSTDLVYDVLRRHEPDHVLLKAARADAANGLARYPAPWSDADTNQRPYRASAARSCVAARRLGDARNRARGGLWRGGG